MSINQYELFPPPTDGITQLRIQSNRYLLASSWDKQIRLYDLQTNTLKTFYQHKAAVLDCCFSNDKKTTYSGGLDKEIKFFDVTTSQEGVVGKHDQAVKCLEFNPQNNTIVSGSWDGTIRIWDPRQGDNACVGTWKQPDKVYSIALSQDKLVVGTCGRNIQIYDFRAMEEPLQQRESSLKYQTRCIRTFLHGEGYVVGSIEGRVAVEYFDTAPEVQAKKYAFKCHRQTINGIDTVYPVNCIAFHPVHGTFATGGCDGTVAIWDGENRKRLHISPLYPTSIAAMAFSEDGSVLAVASSYTYEEGEKDTPPDQIFIRTISDNEARPKSRTTAQ